MPRPLQPQSSGIEIQQSIRLYRPLIDTHDSDDDNRIALLANGGATVNLMGPSIEVTFSASEYDEATTFVGIRATNGATLNLGGDETKNINVSVSENGSALVSSGSPIAIGINAFNNGQIASAPELFVSAENLVVNVHSEDGAAYGIQVGNGTVGSPVKKATLVINAKNTLINATSGREGGYANGIVAQSEGQLAINGNLEVNSENVISARGDAVIRINESGTNTVVLNGDIDFNYSAGSSGTKIDADVLVNLTGASSQWTGNVQRSHDTEPTADKAQVTGFKLIVADNAQWNPTIITRDDTAGVVPIAVNSLTLNDGIINITKAEDQKVAIETLQGSGGTVNVAATTNGTTITSAQLQVTNEVTGAPHLTVNAVGLTSDEITNQKEAMESFYASALNLAEGSDATATLNIVEGGAAGALTAEVAKDGSMVVKEAQNTVNSSLIDIAASNYLFFRTQMNDVSARLGDLRSMPKTAGAWVRYYGGKNKYSSGNMSEKYNTVQLGGDGFINDNFYLGGTFSYTHGDGNLRNGSTDDKNFNFGIYGGWLGDSGQFVDVIIKRHRVKSDFSLYNTMGRNSGSFHSWGTSASVEAGWRLQCPDTGFYVEPQAELQFGRLDSVDYKTNKGVKVEQDGIDSFVGRAGVAVGYTFPENKGNAYAKASVLHDWKGEVKSTFSSNGAKRTYRDDLGGTWGEFAVGGTFNPTKNISAYGQVKTSAGSPVRNPWQVSIGVRYSF